jgi:hypothetical protein
MPGLMGRISTLIKAKISKLLDRAENPGRDTRLRLRAPAGGSAERQERDRRRCHSQEATAESASHGGEAQRAGRMPTY